MDDEIQLQDIIQVLSKYKWLIILGTLLTIAVTLALTLQMPKVYEAKTQILVSVQPLKRQTLEDMYYGTLMAEKLTNTFSQLAQQENLIKKAAKLSQANAKKAQVTIQNQTSTQLFTITIQYPSKKQAALLANSLSKLVVKNINQNKQVKLGYKPRLTLVQPASLPGAPVKPRLKINLLISFILGLLATLTLAFILNSLMLPKQLQDLSLVEEPEEKAAKPVKL